MPRLAFFAAFGATLCAAPGLHAEDALSAPTGSNLALETRADGEQVYVCAEKDNGFAWVFEGPSAALYDKGGHEIGLHGKGPIWSLGDGSAVTGEVIARQDAPDAGDIPWLLLKVKTHAGTFGALTDVTHIRRIDTKGGAAPPDGCEAARRGDIARVHYSAVYQFYKP